MNLYVLLWGDTIDPGAVFQGVFSSREQALAAAREALGPDACAWIDRHDPGGIGRFYIEDHELDSRAAWSS